MNILIFVISKNHYRSSPGGLNRAFSSRDPNLLRKRSRHVGVQLVL